MAQRIYFVGIGGAGLSSLAQLAKDAGYEVLGSDLEENDNVKQLRKAGFNVYVGQDGSSLQKEHHNQPIDWLIASAAIAQDNPELVFAKKAGIKISKRDKLLNTIIEEKHLKLVAVSGTHGKTTVTGMLIWLFKQLNIPVSYAIGTTLSFGPSAAYANGSNYFIYEADEFDRNFLQFKPYLSVIPAVEYDHSDTYPTVTTYKAAFNEFISNSHCCFLYQETAQYLALHKDGCLHVLNSTDSRISEIKLRGIHNRQNGFLALESAKSLISEEKHNLLLTALNNFPGTGRRMEKIADNLYSDYAHLPSEISATLQLANELSQNVVAVYQPHQNIRQHEIKDQYKNCFARAKKVYWLPTYLSREHKKLPVLKPAEFVKNLSTPKSVEIADMDDQLAIKINQHRQNGDLVILMGAGSIDAWARKNLVG